MKFAFVSKDRQCYFYSVGALIYAINKYEMEGSVCVITKTVPWIYDGRHEYFYIREEFHRNVVISKSVMEFISKFVNADSYVSLSERFLIIKRR